MDNYGVQVYYMDGSRAEQTRSAHVDESSEDWQA